MVTKRNAIIMAAGTSSRFVPLAHECPKGLLKVKGDVLIERQIRQLKEAGVYDITIVVGYMANKFAYLKKMYQVDIVMNEDFARYNNVSSLIKVIDRLDDTFICSSDNYFPENVFIPYSDESYYSALYANGLTSEYCLITDSDDHITGVTIGGKDAWYMVGHVYLTHEFSKAFRNIFVTEYENEETRYGYWEDLYIRHLDHLPLIKINRYQAGAIYEFDSLDELRLFDESYMNDTRSQVIKDICKILNVSESDIHDCYNIKHEGDYLNFHFKAADNLYEYNNINGLKIMRR